MATSKNDKNTKILLVGGGLAALAYFAFTEKKGGKRVFKPINFDSIPFISNQTPSTGSVTTAGGGATISTNGVIKKGDKGNAVITLQRYLREVKGFEMPLSYNPTTKKYDGIFGNETKIGVDKYGIPYPVPLTKITEFEAVLKVTTSVSTTTNSGGVGTSYGTFNAKKIGDEIYQSINSIGTDEERLKRAYTQIKTAQQWSQVVEYFFNTYGRSMEAWIDSDLNDSATDLFEYREYRRKIMGGLGSLNGFTDTYYAIYTIKPTSILDATGSVIDRVSKGVFLGIALDHSSDNEYIVFSDMLGERNLVSSRNVSLSVI